MGVFPEKRFGKRVCAGSYDWIYLVQKGKEGKIFMEKSAELCAYSVGTLAEYGKKVKEKLGGLL